MDVIKNHWDGLCVYSARVLCNNGNTHHWATFRQLEQVCCAAIGEIPVLQSAFDFLWSLR